MTPFPCISWFPDGPTLSHLRQGNHFLDVILSGLWRFNPVSRIMVLIEAPVNTSIAFGKIVSFGAAAAIVVCSTWVARFVRWMRSSHQFDPADEDRHLETELDLFDEEVEIKVRIDDHGFDILRKPRCVMTIHLSKEGTRGVKRALGKVSGTVNRVTKCKITRCHSGFGDDRGF